jgi:predicted PurR-regulated permease PerM
VAAVLLAYAITGLIVAMALFYVVPLAVKQSLMLAHVLPGFVREAQHFWDAVLVRFHEAPIPAAVRTAVNQSTHGLEKRAVGLVRSGLGMAVGLVPGLVAFLVSPILAFYLLKDLNGMKDKWWRLIPVPWQPAVYKLGVDLDHTLASYIRGQLLVAASVGILSGGLSAFLGIPFAVLIGILAAITDVIPYVGPIVGAAPAVLLGFIHSPWIGLYALIGFLLIHQLEGVILAPLVVGDAVGLHPLLVVLAILMGGELGGLGGMLVAVPAAAAMKVLATHLYRRLAQDGGMDTHPIHRRAGAEGLTPEDPASLGPKPARD